MSVKSQRSARLPILLLRLLFTLSFAIVSAYTIAQDAVVVVGDSSLYQPGRTVILTGTIRERGTLTPVAGASLYLDGTKFGNNTDTKGMYQISLPNGRHRLTIRYLGMTPVQKRIAVFSNGVLDIEMDEKIQSLDEVIVKARKEDYNVRETLGGVTTINTAELKKLPSFFGEIDIIKSIQLLPGVSSVGEGTAGFNVRGGRVDQNLVTLDGAQIFNSSHMLGFFSAFNPDVTESFTLYKGSIPAQFGGRLSSVLDVNTRNGDFNKTSFKGGIGLTSARLSVDGPLFKDRTSFIVGTRFSYSDWMLGLVKNIDVKNSSASFYDINASVSHKLNKYNIIALSVYRSTDYFLYSDQFGYRYTTQLGTLKWNSLISDKLTSHLSVTYGDYGSSYFKPTGADGLNIDNGIRYMQAKQTFGYSAGEKQELHFGAEFNHYESHPEKSTPYGEQSGVVRSEYDRSTGREMSLFINDEIDLSSKITISLGLRYTLYQNIGRATVYTYREDTIKTVHTILDTVVYGKNKVIKAYGGLEPRVSARFNLSPASSVKLGYNRVKQYINLISNTTAAAPVDLWQVCTYHTPPQAGNNFSLGYYHNFKENRYETFAEVFYKQTENLVEYRDFAELLQTDHLETELVRGKGKSYGLELYVRKAQGDWTGWVSYTYSRSLVKVLGTATQESVNNGAWYPSNYDKPNSVSIVGNRKLGASSAFAFNIVYATGRPLSAIETSYQSGGTTVPIFSSRNAYRIPDYLRLDVSLTVGGIFKKVKDDLTFSIYNLLGRRNAYSVYYQRQSSYPLPQSYKLSLLGSALPSVTYNISF
jgi:hypothetical protein